jgi:hypothetical protein
MPFNINLYHEVLRTRREEQYDPLRLSMIGLGVIMACLAGYYLLALAGKSSVVSAYESKQRTFRELTPKVAAAVKEEEEMNKTLGVSDKMTQRMEDRFYWGPVFEQLILSVPPTVQITRCAGNVAPDAARKVQLVMEGITAGEEPFKVADNFRLKLIELLGTKYKEVAAKLDSLETSADKVTYGDARLSTARFTMTVTFTLKTAVPPPPPAQPKAKGIAKQKEDIL